MQPKFQDLYNRHSAFALDQQLLLVDLIGDLPWTYDLQTGILSFGDRFAWHAEILGTESAESCSQAGAGMAGTVMEAPMLAAIWVTTTIPTTQALATLTPSFPNAKKGSPVPLTAVQVAALWSLVVIWSEPRAGIMQVGLESAARIWERWEVLQHQLYQTAKTSGANTSLVKVV